MNKKQLIVTSILISLMLLLSIVQGFFNENFNKVVLTDNGISEFNEYNFDESNYIILDVRTPEEFKDKHIPNAINVPNESIGTNVISELPDKNQLILVYCRSGNRSQTGSQTFVDLGYKNVIEMGGILDWEGNIVK